MGGCLLHEFSKRTSFIPPWCERKNSWLSLSSCRCHKQHKPPKTHNEKKTNKSSTKLDPLESAIKIAAAAQKEAKIKSTSKRRSSYYYFTHEAILCHILQKPTKKQHSMCYVLSTHLLSFSFRTLNFIPRTKHHAFFFSLFLGWFVCFTNMSSLFISHKQQTFYPNKKKLPPSTITTLGF